MPTKVHKKDIEILLKKSDVLEAVAEKIDRSSPKSSKRTAANRFLSSANKLIEDERDVLLIAVKLK